MTFTQLHLIEIALLIYIAVLVTIPVVARYKSN